MDPEEQRRPAARQRPPEEPRHRRAELERFKEVGGQTVVEVSSGGLVPNYVGLAEIARADRPQHRRRDGVLHRGIAPGELADKSVGQIADEMLRDVVEGYPGHRRPGGRPRRDRHHRAALTDRAQGAGGDGRVQAQTGDGDRAAPGLGPPDLRADRPDARSPGAGRRSAGPGHHQPLRRPPAPSYDSYAKLAARGCTLAFDTFGKQSYYATRGRQYPSDEQRIATIARLVADGLAGSVTLSHDVCYKTDLTRWGGDGYGHICRNIVPRLEGHGVSVGGDPADAGRNPRRLLPLTR